MFIILLILSISFISSERYIVQTDNENPLPHSLDSKIVKEISSFALTPKITDTSKDSTSKKIYIVETNEKELKDSNIILYEKDFEIKSLVSTPWNYEVIGIDFNNIDSNSEFGKNVKIAVLDSGVDYNLLNVKKGPDFVNNDFDPYDDNGHGTFVTQILKLPSSKKPLVKSDIYAVKVLDSNGLGFVSDLIDGINWAVDNDMDIILLSLGSESDSFFLADTINSAYDSGIIIIAAVGNDGNDNIYYPAGYEDVIGIGSVNSNLNKSTFSNYGDVVEFTSPGENILVTDGINQYIVSGTSFSVPHAGIVAASIISGNPSFDNQQIKEYMKSTSIDLGATGRDDLYGYGLLVVNTSFNLSTNNSLFELESRVTELENKVSLLESWKNTIDLIITSIQESIQGLLIKTDNLENNLANLKNNITSSPSNFNSSSYLQYLSASDRRKMVCGFAEDNHLEIINDLGYDCELTYTQLRSGNERVRCRCIKTN